MPCWLSLSSVHEFGGLNAVRWAFYQLSYLSSSQFLFLISFPSTLGRAHGLVFSTELHSQPQPSQVNTCRCLSSLLITCFKMFSITFIYCGSGAWVCHSAHVEVRESTQVGPLFLPCGTRGWTSVIRLGGMCLLYLLSYPWSTESTEGGMVACNPSTLTQLKTGGC